LKEDFVLEFDYALNCATGSYADYSPYDMPSQPLPRYNNNYQNNNGYQNNGYQNNYQGNNNYSRPMQQNNGHKDIADEIQNQFSISDDDLPF
jgi:Tfp pilus tip-associated adhesin PilY1